VYKFHEISMEIFNEIFHDFFVKLSS